MLLYLVLWLSFIIKSIHPPIVVGFEHALRLVNDRVEVVVVVHLVADEAIALELRLEEHREELDLLVGELGVPKVKDQVDSGGLSIVPGLMVE